MLLTYLACQSHRNAAIVPDGVNRCPKKDKISVTV